MACSGSEPVGSAAGVDAAGAASPGPVAAPVYAHAEGHFTPIRQSKLVDPAATDATALDLQTASWPVEGRVSFRTTRLSVDLELTLTQCRKPYAYPVHIYAASDCTQIHSGSQPWDGARGMLGSQAYCFGAPGALFESRAAQSGSSWSLGGAPESNLIGRTVVIHDPDTHMPLVCAKIEVADGGKLAQAREVETATRPRSAVSAQLAGLCVLGPGAFGKSPQSCPNLDAAADCALTHCVAECLPQCGDYVACLDAAPSACNATCHPADECASCLSASTQCMLGYCKHELSCAPPPTPGGPCTELRNCCARQGPLVDSCNHYAELMEQQSGDASCLEALHDAHVHASFTYRSPCTPDAKR